MSYCRQSQADSEIYVYMGEYGIQIHGHEKGNEKGFYNLSTAEALMALDLIKKLGLKFPDNLRSWILSDGVNGRNKADTMASREFLKQLLLKEPAEA